MGKMICWYCKYRGGLYIKLGQILSNQKASFSYEFIKELETLQHNIKHNLTQSELDTLLSKIHPDIQNVSIVEAGSVAVVFKGEVNGSIVAIKIVRPNIHEIIKTQEKSITWWVSKLDYYYPQYFLSHKWKRIYKILLEQLDMNNEAANMNFFHTHHKNLYVTIPKSYDVYSTQSQLVMDWVDGVTLTQIESLQLDEETKKTLASKYAMFLKESHEYGYVHMDLHPGNIMITQQHDMAIIDFGLVAKYESSKSKQFFQLIDSSFQKNPEIFTDSFIDMYICHTLCDDIPSLRNDIIQHYKNVYTKDKSNGYPLIQGMYKIAEKHNIYIDHELADFELCVLSAKDTFISLWDVTPEQFYLLLS